MGMQTFTYEDVGGGINETDPVTGIADNEFESVLNFYPLGRNLTKRKGTLKLSTVALGTTITGIFSFYQAPYAPNTARSKLPLVGSTTLFAQLAAGGGSWVTFTNLGAALVSSLYPWTFKQYNGVVFGIRPNTILQRIYSGSTEHNAAGIAAPGAAAVISDAGAGVMAAGAYQLVVAFYNSLTGAESNYGPVSNTLTQVVNKSINVASIPVSTNPQVNARRLYLTLPGRTGEYLFVLEIANNTATTATINVTIAGMGPALASNLNGLPPTDIYCGDLWNNRLALGSLDGTLSLSELGLPESFATLQYAIGEDDSTVLRGVHALDSRTLIVGKTGGLYAFTGDDRRNFAQEKISDKAGVYSHYSMQSVEKKCYFYGGDDVYVTDGVNVYGIGDQKIRHLLKQIPAARREFVVGETEPRLNQYVLSISTAGASTNNLALIYNYREGKWTTYSYTVNGTAAPNALAFGRDTDELGEVYASFSGGYLFKLHSASLTKDEVGGSTALAFPTQFRTKAYDFGFPSLQKGIRRVGLFFALTGQFFGDITLKLFAADSARAIAPAGAVKSRTLTITAISTPQAADNIKRVWVRANLSTLQKMAANWQLDFSCAVDMGEVTVEGIQFDSNVTKRRPRVN